MTIGKTLFILDKMAQLRKKGDNYLLEYLFSDELKKLLNEGNKTQQQNQVQNNKPKKPGQKDIGRIIRIKGKDYVVENISKNLASISLIDTPLNKNVMISANDFHDYLGVRNVTTLVGKVHVDSVALEKHFKEKVQFMDEEDAEKELWWRESLAEYFLMTLKNPSELWLNYRNNQWSFVFIKKFRVEIKGKMENVNMVAVVPVNTMAVKTYFGEKRNISRVNNQRKTYLIRPKRKGEENNSSPIYNI